ncbi:glycoside hydrolase family 13 protein [candidate division KSB1 bacterium]|nr:glycoside hydrolase family 13 protein [candidate division KSB1 bacterium]
MEAKELSGHENPAASFVPEWARHVVWYQIFPERFRNGDQTNDPQLEDLNGAWPHDVTSAWELHPWTADWYQLQPYEQKNGKDIWYNIQRRRLGGDLQGILDKLDYLVDLGIGAIYLNPVFAAPSSHKYDASTYHHIDPNFGPEPRLDRQRIAAENPADPRTWVWTAADQLMLRLIQEVHRRGLKIIFDGVFNHTGLKHWAFVDVQQHQQRSPFRDWYQIKSWDDPRLGTKYNYAGWFGVRELPQFAQDAQGIVAGPRDYIFAITRRWMDPNGDGDPADGIDGWRLDVAFCVHHNFWKSWRQHVKQINPNAYLTAEVIDSNAALQPYLQGDEFDAVMNYNFAFLCADYFIAVKNQISTWEFDHRLTTLREAFPPPIAFVQQNLLDSHDTSRLGTQIVNRDLGRFGNWGEYFNLSKAQNPAYATRRPTTGEWQIQKLMALFQMTYLGAPMIYYGDEVGMWGANDPDCRKPMLWDDLEYVPASVLPDQSQQTIPDPVQVNPDLWQHYRQLIRLRNQEPALRIGDFQTILCADQSACYIFLRKYQADSILVALNNSQSVQEINLRWSDASVWRDLLNDHQVFMAENGNFTLTLPPKWGRILKKE